MSDEERMPFILDAKAEMRRNLRSLSWEEKVASMERMNAAGKIAREGMRKALEEERSKANRVS